MVLKVRVSRGGARRSRSRSNAAAVIGAWTHDGPQDRQPRAPSRLAEPGAVADWARVTIIFKLNLNHESGGRPPRHGHRPPAFQPELRIGLVPLILR